MREIIINDMLSRFIRGVYGYESLSINQNLLEQFGLSYLCI